MQTAISLEELNAINRTAGDANGLPSRFYTQADCAQSERDSLLSSTWTCIGFANDLPKSHARPVALMGLPLAIVRDPSDQVRVFHNVCRHRGHRLIPQAGPIKGVIRCPYHSWTYGFDGQLRGTPHIGGHGVHQCERFDRANRGLHEVRSAYWMGLVFVNLCATAEPFDAHIEPLMQRWRAFVGAEGFDRLRPTEAEERMTLSVDCNWKLAVENYCESYHLPWVHPSLNSYSKIEDHYNIIADDWGSGQGTRVFEFSDRAGIRLPRFASWPAERMKIAEYIAFFPNVLLGLQNDHFFAIHLNPLSEGRTLETLQLYYLDEAATDEAYRAARQTVLEGWREVFQEDVDVCEEMQRGRQSTAFDGGVFSPELDVATHHFHQWVANRLPREPSVADDDTTHVALASV